MGAALRTAGDMQAPIRRQMWRERSGKRTRFGARLRTGGRTGASHDAEQRIVATHHKAIVLGHCPQPFNQDHPPGRHAKAGREPGKIFESRALQLPEGKADERATGAEPGRLRRCGAWIPR